MHFLYLLLQSRIASNVFFARRIRLARRCDMLHPVASVGAHDCEYTGAPDECPMLECLCCFVRNMLKM